MSTDLTAMQVQPAAEPDLRPGARNVADPRCIRCGYSLIGLDTRRPCPECGLLAGFSLLDGEELRLNRPGWLRMLSLGAALLAPALLLMPGVGVAAAIFGAAGRGNWWAAGVDWRAWGVAWAVGLPPTALLLLGVWLLTRRAGAQRIDGIGVRTRRLLRIAALLPLLLVSLCALVSSGVLGGDWHEIAWSWPLWTISVAFFAGFVARLFWHLRSLAARAPAPLLAADSPVVGTVLAACILLQLAYWLIGVFDTDASAFARGRLGDVLLSIQAILAAVGITAWFWSIYLLIRYNIAFTSAARQARQLMADFDASRNPTAVAYDPAP